MEEARRDGLLPYRLACPPLTQYVMGSPYRLGHTKYQSKLGNNASIPAWHAGVGVGIICPKHTESVANLRRANLCGLGVPI